MADVQVAKFMGLNGIRDKARTWLNAAADDKPLYEMKKQNDELKDRVRELERMVRDMSKQFEDESLTDAQKKRRATRAKNKAKELAEE